MNMIIVILIGLFLFYGCAIYGFIICGNKQVSMNGGVDDMPKSIQLSIIGMVIGLVVFIIGCICYACLFFGI